VDAAPGNVILERWTSGARTPVIVRIPGLHSNLGYDEPLNYNGIFSARTADDVFAAGIVNDDREREGRPQAPRPYLLHFDGKSWAVQETPLRHPVRSMARTPDGALLLATYSNQFHQGEFWHRAPTGAWTRIRMPAIAAERRADEMQPLSVWTTSGGDTWVLASTWSAPSERATMVLYRNRPAARTIVLPGPDEVEASRRALAGSSGP
jgi:hypothetical protein